MNIFIFSLICTVLCHFSNANIPVEKLPLELVNVYGKGGKYFMPASLTNFSIPKNLRREQHSTFSVRTPTKKLIGASVALKYCREGSIYSLKWLGEKPHIYFQPVLQEINYNLCLIDGKSDVPCAKVLHFPKGFRPGLIAISGVMQGDQIIIECYEKEQRHYNSLAVVKGFTWNDYQRLKKNNKKLTFAPELKNIVPKKMQENVVSTIEFALEPPKAKPGRWTSQQRQRIAMHNKIQKNFNGSYQNFPYAFMLATLEIPSTMAIGFWPQEDMWHFHFAFSNENMQCWEKVASYHSYWYDKAVELGITGSSITFKKELERIKVVRHYLQTLSKLKKVLHTLVNAKQTPFAIYHTYENYVFDSSIEKSLRRYNRHNYYRHPQQKNYSGFLTTGDPIRNIKTFFFDNQPSLFLPLNAHKALGNWTKMPATYNVNFTMYFFINRKGQVVLHPFRFNIPATKALIVADALRENW